MPKVKCSMDSCKFWIGDRNNNGEAIDDGECSKGEIWISGIRLHLEKAECLSFEENKE